MTFMNHYGLYLIISLHKVYLHVRDVSDHHYIVSKLFNVKHSERNGPHYNDLHDELTDLIAHFERNNTNDTARQLTTALDEIRETFNYTKWL
jgi:hypothetical protein